MLLHGPALRVFAVISSFSALFLQFASAKQVYNWTSVKVFVGGVGYDPAHKVNVPPVDQWGYMPDLVLWDNLGHLLGYKAAKTWMTRKWFRHDEAYIDMWIRMPKGEHGDPAYLLVNQVDTNGICVSHIKVFTVQGRWWDWLGDVGALCGGPWYYNTIPSNDKGHYPLCLWLDKPNDGDLTYPETTPPKHYNVQAIAIHLWDFVPSAGRIKQRYKHPELTCQSIPRFGMYHDFNRKQAIPIFNPPLLYDPSNGDTDWNVSKVVDVPGTCIGRFGCPEPHKFGKEMWLTSELQPEDYLTRRKRDVNATRKVIFNNSSDTRSNMRKQRAYRPFHENHVVTSDFTQHSAQKLCDSHTSSGPDFVSIQEQLLCDMSTGHLWPLCGATHGVEDACFDLDSKAFRNPAHGLGRRDERSGRDVPLKSYASEDEWRYGKANKKIKF